MKKIVITMVLIILAVPLVVFADGRTDYKANCAGCHGADAMASPKKAKALQVNFMTLSLTASRKEKPEMIAIIEKGKGKMPDFEKELTKDRIAAIVDYIFAISTKNSTMK